MPNIYQIDNIDNSLDIFSLEAELPPFTDLEKHYPKYGIDYIDGGISSSEFGKIVGGKVQFNIDLYEKTKNTSQPEGFSNTCALRISHTLNENNHFLPSKPYVASSSSKKKWYIFRVLQLEKYLTKNYGEPDIVVKKEGSKEIFDTKFIGHKGIIIFDTRGTWSDATGHATLWNGKKRLGGNYESDFYFKNSSTVKLWKAN